MTKKQTKTNNLTEVVFILDRSGSMAGLESDTIGGFNSMIKKQKKEHTNALISTVLFDHEATVLHDRIKVDDVPLMTEKEYSTRGTTALLDAIGSAISHIATIQKYARKEDKPTKTLFVITTDGYENASKTYTFEKIRKTIEKQREKEGWEFIFLGADIDAIGTAAKIGIDKDYAANVIKDEKGVGVLYQTVSNAVCCCCMEEPISPLKADWKKKIERDYILRKGLKK